VFGGDALEASPDGGNPILSLEHSISAKVGGTDRTATLVCTECNNRDGNRLDAHIVNRLETEAFLRGHSDRPMKSNLIVGGQKASVNWSFRGGNAPNSDIYIVEKATRRRTTEIINDALSRGTPGELTLNFPWRHKQRVSQVAMLRMAFLLTFRKFGYAFALNECMDPVLRQINCPEELLLPSAFCLDFDRPVIDDNAIMIVKEPKEFRSLVVMLNMRVQKHIVSKGVILPGPFDTDLGIYERHDVLRSKGEKFKWTGANLNKCEIDLNEPDAAFFLFQIWTLCCPD
jgi:hypothetical protein